MPPALEEQQPRGGQHRAGITQKAARGGLAQELGVWETGSLGMGLVEP